MNQALWRSLEKLRGSEFRSVEDILNILKQDAVNVTAEDMPFVARFITLRLGHRFGIQFVPDWLCAVIAQLSEQADGKAVLDPCAGIGTILAAIQQALHPVRTIAVTINHEEARLGEFLVPGVEWHAADALDFLRKFKDDFDVVASNLPFNISSRNPVEVSAPDGSRVQLSDDIGHLILVAASMHLKANGIGLFVVAPKFFFEQRNVREHFATLGLSLHAALALPPGTFAPFTNIETYLIVVRKVPTNRLFVAQLSTDTKTNGQIISNFRAGKEGGSLDLGRFTDVETFRGIQILRIEDRFREAQQQFGVPAIQVQNFATAVNLGRPAADFAFPRAENSIFIPLVGKSRVVTSLEDGSLKKQNYAQVVIDPARSDARFVAHFLNSEFGRELREMSKTGAFIPKLNKQTIRSLQIFVPPLEKQRALLDLEGRLAAEENTVLGLHNEITEMRRALWSNMETLPDIGDRIRTFSTRLSPDVKKHTAERLDQWFETLPFPLASILRAWQATPNPDFKQRQEHLLHFFEATAEFTSVILLSAFGSSPGLWEPHRQKINDALQNQNLTFERSTFGTWKLVVEYLGKQVRQLLEGNEDGRTLCGEIFADTSLILAEAVSNKELVRVLAATNKMRNDWSGHGGVTGQDEARLRSEQLLSELQKLRDAMGDVWEGTQLVHALHTIPRRGVFENELAVLMGSNSEFLKESRSMSMWLDVERLYLLKKDLGRALLLLPFVTVGPSPQSAKNACYFFNRLERDGVRFVSYHYIERPELKEPFEAVAQALKALTDE